MLRTEIGIVNRYIGTIPNDSNYESCGARSTAKSEVSRELRYAVKTLESKETRASKEITVTHNSVFAAHRLQCRMTNRKNRHPAFCFAEILNLGSARRRELVSATQPKRTSTPQQIAFAYHAISQSAKHVRRQAANGHRA